MTTDIKDTASLNAAINKLKNSVREKEQSVKRDLSGVSGEGSAKEKRKHIAGEVLKTASSLLLNRLFKYVFKARNK